MAAAAPKDSTSPPGGSQIARVENGGLLFTDNSAGVSGLDGGFSLPIGRQTLWFFGDAFLLDPTAPAKPYVGNVSNCALLVSKGRGSAPLRRYTFLTDPHTGLARPVIPTHEGEGNETRLWPLGSWYDAAHKTVYLYYFLVKFTGEGGPLGFKVLGYGLARGDVGDPSRLQFIRLKASDGSDLWGKTGQDPMLGIAVVSGARGNYVYLLGYRKVGEKKKPLVARVLKDRITEFGAYEYFSGSAEQPRWSRDSSQAAGIEGLDEIPDMASISYNSYLKGYLAVHSVGITEKIRFSLAPHPWGPYTRLGEIGAPHQAFSKSFCYAGMEHPELAEENGKIVYVTYVDYERYWLQLFKVTLR
jgi:hypothetical protein